jgi:thioredoxin 1
VSPVVEELSQEYGGIVDFVKINIDENNELAQKYDIFSISTLTIFKNGEQVSQQAGAASKSPFKTMMDSSLN